VSRRVTGGDAILFDESQLGWELVCRFDALGLPSRPSEALLEDLARPMVAALAELGLEARYRPRNDIEVGGRKISGTGGTELRGALLFQGTLLVDFDIEAMVRALRVPVEKLRRQELMGMRDRVTWLGRELGRVPDHAELAALLARHAEAELGITLVPGELTGQEREALEARLGEHGSDAWVFGRGRPGGDVGKSIHPTDGGVVRAVVRTGADPRRILAAVIDGDFFAFPRRAIYDLEARLKGASAAQVPALVARHFAERELVVPGVGPEGFAAALLEALERASGGPLGLGPRQLNALFPVGCRLEEAARLRPTHLLLPYCAKPAACARRRDDGCDRCGECSVGAAYDAGEAAGLEVRSITSFEHLLDTLAELRAAGAPGFVGSCCEAFYRKHRRELEGAGVPGLLFDVEGAETCYDLGKSAYAYAGEYEGETSVDLALLGVLLERFHARPAAASREASP
jgi:lipoate-protein ligase A